MAYAFGRGYSRSTVPYETRTVSLLHGLWGDSGFGGTTGRRLSQSTAQFRSYASHLDAHYTFTLQYYQCYPDDQDSTVSMLARIQSFGLTRSIPVMSS
jgi:hypothetical protein